MVKEARQAAGAFCRLRFAIHSFAPLFHHGEGRRNFMASASRFTIHLSLFTIAVLFAGCAAPPQPTASKILRVDPWVYQDGSGSTVITQHYVIYTTISDMAWLDLFARLMEGALHQYSRIVPGVDLSQRPMECYLFANRQQWAAFTKEKTGSDATTYLHISRGGYTVRDWYVAFNIGQAGTFSVAAHEGFHQFAARHFKTRIPPFLEEGIACMFENVQWDGDQPVWNLSENPSRLSSLRTAIDAKQRIPLSDLIRLHAGQVVEGPKARISAFYGESWAFAQFLWMGEDQKFRPRLQRLLADAAAGQIQGIPGRPLDAVFWNPSTAKPLLEQYLGEDLQTLDAEFRIYVSHMLDEPAAQD